MNDKELAVMAEAKEFMTTVKKVIKRRPRRVWTLIKKASGKDVNTLEEMYDVVIEKIVEGDQKFINTFQKIASIENISPRGKASFYNMEGEDWVKLGTGVLTSATAIYAASQASKNQGEQSQSPQSSSSNLEDLMMMQMMNKDEGMSTGTILAIVGGGIAALIAVALIIKN